MAQYLDLAVDEDMIDDSVRHLVPAESCEGTCGSVGWQLGHESCVFPALIGDDGLVGRVVRSDVEVAHPHGREIFAIDFFRSFGYEFAALLARLLANVIIVDVEDIESLSVFSFESAPSTYSVKG